MNLGGISEHRSPFSEQTRRFWLSGRAVALDVSKRDGGCSAFEDPFWCWLKVGATLHLGFWNSHLKEVSVEVLHAF